MISVISSILIWSAVAIIAIRVITTSGNFNATNNVMANLNKDYANHTSFNVTNKETACVFGLAFLFRVIVFIISAFAIFMVNDGEFSFSEWINSYLQWDAHNYHRIAQGGYTFHTENGAYTTLAFFPLYPWLIRLLNVFINNYIVSGILLSGLLYSGACAFMYKLLALDYNKATAVRAIIYISVFPHSLFFGVMMNESMLLITSVATLYYIRKHNWPMVGIFGALAALSRMAGLLLAIPAAVEWLEHYKIIEKLRQKKIGEVWKLFYQKGLWIFLMLLGTGIYLFCNYKTTGEWFKFLEYQKTIWDNGAVYFGKGISIMAEYAAVTRTFALFALWLPEVISVAFVIAMLIYGLRKHRNMYTSFLVIYIIINTGFAWPISIARYMTCAIPAFVILADFSDRHKWTEPIITTTMAITFGVFFVAYFMSRQIL